MAYRALKTFCGLVSMVRGEVREIPDEAIVKDLIKSGFIEDLGGKEKTAKGSKPSKNKGGDE